MTSKLKTDVLETVSGSGTIALTNQLSGMTSASVPLLDHTKMPAGSVIQSIRNSSSSRTIETTSTSFVGTGIVVQITPKYANSIMHLNFSTSMAFSSGAMTGRMYFKLDGGSYGVMTDSPVSGAGDYTICYISTSNNNYSPINCQLKYQCSALTTLFFQPYFKTTTGTGALSHASSSNSFTVTEIKQ